MQRVWNSAMVEELARYLENPDRQYDGMINQAHHALRSQVYGLKMARERIRELEGAIRSAADVFDEEARQLLAKSPPDAAKADAHTKRATEMRALIRPIDLG